MLKPNFAIFGLIYGMLILIFGFLQLAVTSFSLAQLWVQLMLIFVDKIGLDYTSIIWIVITVVCMIPDALLLIGISKKKPSLLIPWLVIKMVLLVVKFIYFEKATKFCEIFPFLLTAVHTYIQSKVRGRFRKILWPSQNIRTLCCYKTDYYLFFKKWE